MADLQTKESLPADLRRRSQRSLPLRTVFCHRIKHLSPLSQRLCGFHPPLASQEPCVSPTEHQQRLRVLVGFNLSLHRLDLQHLLQVTTFQALLLMQQLNRPNLLSVETESKTDLWS